jgi:hypothetical protein
LVLHTSGESELLQVEHAASDKIISIHSNCFIGRPYGQSLMVSDPRLAFQLEHHHPPIYAAQRIPKKCVNAGSAP